MLVCLSVSWIPLFSIMALRMILELCTVIQVQKVTKLTLSDFPKKIPNLFYKQFYRKKEVFKNILESTIQISFILDQNLLDNNTKQQKKPHINYFSKF